ncbi:hypothetical protein [uncultured Tolumonas sp.]|uniref:hypothetical protein n=1 Tax=uncultured Tolumonas sp. TaxID=263765 RepID=UPI002A0A1D4E|nr:hypothetical protein [uncultured Tolumonas sp.]
MNKEQEILQLLEKFNENLDSKKLIASDKTVNRFDSQWANAYAFSLNDRASVQQALHRHRKALSKPDVWLEILFTEINSYFITETIHREISNFVKSKRLENVVKITIDNLLTANLSAKDNSFDFATTHIMSLPKTDYTLYKPRSHHLLQQRARVRRSIFSECIVKKPLEIEWNPLVIECKSFNKPDSGIDMVVINPTKHNYNPKMAVTVCASKRHQNASKSNFEKFISERNSECKKRTPKKSQRLPIHEKIEQRVVRFNISEDHYQQLKTVVSEAIHDPHIEINKSTIESVISSYITVASPGVSFSANKKI